MAQITMPHSLVAGTPENINDVQDNFQEVTDFLNNALVGDDNLTSPNNSVARVVFEVGGAFASAPGAGTFLLASQGSWVTTSSANAVPIWIPDTADVAVAGKTTQIRLVTFLILNATSPGVNFTAGLNHISAAGGGSGVLTFTLGGAISTVFTAPAGTSSPRGESSWTNLASLTAGSYCFTIAPSGAAAAASVISVTSQVEMRHV